MEAPRSSAKLVTVFGGSGFIGRYVVQALAKRGYRIRVADGSRASERIEHVRLDRPNGTKRVWWERDGRKGLGGLSPSIRSMRVRTW